MHLQFFGINFHILYVSKRNLRFRIHNSICNLILSSRRSQPLSILVDILILIYYFLIIIVLIWVDFWGYGLLLGHKGVKLLHFNRGNH